MTHQMTHRDAVKNHEFIGFQLNGASERLEMVRHDASTNEHTMTHQWCVILACH